MSCGTGTEGKQWPAWHDQTDSQFVGVVALRLIWCCIDEPQIIAQGALGKNVMCDGHTDSRSQSTELQGMTQYPP